MNKMVWLDTETSGLRPGQICQVSYIIDANGYLEGKNMFFSVDYIEPGAAETTGFDVESLRNMSGGLTFADRASEIAEDLKGSMLICHNVNFDRKFLDMEFYRLGMLAGYEKTFCTMEFFTPLVALPKKRGSGYKFPRLEEVADWLMIDRDKVASYAQKVFGTSSRISFHDARFDTTLMVVCMKAYLEAQRHDFTGGWFNEFAMGRISK